MRVSAFLVQRGDNNTSKVIHDWQTCEVAGLVESVVASAIINNEAEFIGTIVIDEPYNTLRHTVRCYATEYDASENLAWIVCVSEHGAPEHDEITSLVDENRDVMDRVWRKRSLIRRFLEWID